MLTSLCAKLCYNLTIDLHHASLNELISFATRTNAGIGEILVQTDWFVRINMCLLILNLLLHAVLGMRIVAVNTRTAVVTTLTLLIGTLSLLVAAFSLLIATFTIVARTGLIATFSLPITG